MALRPRQKSMDAAAATTTATMRLRFPDTEFLVPIESLLRSRWMGSHEVLESQRAFRHLCLTFDFVHLLKTRTRMIPSRAEFQKLFNGKPLTKDLGLLRRRVNGRVVQNPTFDPSSLRAEDAGRKPGRNEWIDQCVAYSQSEVVERRRRHLRLRDGKNAREAARQPRLKVSATIAIANPVLFEPHHIPPDGPLSVRAIYIELQLPRLNCKLTTSYFVAPEGKQDPSERDAKRGSATSEWRVRSRSSRRVSLSRSQSASISSSERRS